MVEALLVPKVVGTKNQDKQETKENKRRGHGAYYDARGGRMRARFAPKTSEGSNFTKTG